MRKQIIREILFPDQIEAATFLNPNGSIIIGHNGKVSSIAETDYHLYESPFSMEFTTSFDDANCVRKRVADEKCFKQLEKLSMDNQR